MNPGKLIAGKYRIERSIGAGGGGMVLAATHLQLNQPVAIKFMRAETARDPDAVERFMREGRAVARLKSEHVARVLDVGNLEDAGPFIVMEYLEGRDLASIIKGCGPIPFDEAIEYILQVCEALAEAHALGIVHRDLKPRNLFVTHHMDMTPLVKVLDFGIAKASAFGEETVTKTEMFMGSPWYMPPEQMESARDVDARSDIWSLGIVLYQMVSGRLPFEAETFPRVCAKVLSDPPNPLSRWVMNLPAGFEAVVLRCLEKDRADRYVSVGEFARALLPYAPKRARESATRIATLQGIELPESQPPPQLERVSLSEATWKPPPKRRLSRLLAAVVGLGALGALVSLLVAGRGPSTLEVTLAGAPAEATSDEPGRHEAVTAPSASAAPTGEPAAAPPIETVAQPSETPPTQKSGARPVGGTKPRPKPTALAKTPTPEPATAPPAAPEEPADAKSYR